MPEKDKRVHIGDGAYVSDDGYHLILESGITGGEYNQIYLEQGCLNNLDKWRREHWDLADDEKET